MYTGFKTAAVAAVAAMAVTPAVAGSPEPAPVEPVIMAAPPAPASPDWTGFSAGAQLGYGDVSATGGLSGDGAIGGLTAGYDWDLGNWVVGAGADYDFSNIDVGGATDLDNVLRLKLRGGYKLGNGLAYASAGAARAYTSALGDDNGWYAGVGYEHLVTSNISVGGEILYHEFDNFDGSGVDVEATTAQARVNFRF